MTAEVSPSTAEKALENAKKRKLLDIKHIPASQLPYRIAKERTGVVLGSFTTELEVDTFIDGYPLKQLQSIPTRRRTRG